MDHARLSRELLRALRGRRAQRSLSKRLGYRTNVVYTWESGRREPSAAEALGLARAVGVDPAGALRGFFRSPPEWLDRLDPATPEAVRLLLVDLAGELPAVELAARTGVSRHAVGRLLRGQAQPSLAELLRLVDAASRRALDLVACFVDPARLPSFAAAWADLSARRAIAADLPWSQAVLRVLELEAYRSMPAHRPGWIAHLLGISAVEEARCLEALVDAGQVVAEGGTYRPAAVLTVDTRPDPAAGRRQRRHWCEVALDRLARDRPGLYSYNVFTVSSADLERIREMHLAYFRALRAVVAASEPGEHVVVANVHLFSLADAPR
ncbi:MAG: helix-turn-helix domain-containing protein [Myxococcota bacterium]